MLDLDLLNDYLEGLRADFPGAGEFQVEIEYVDVDKMPYDRSWANNVFFEGQGREYETHVSTSLLASLMFSTEGLNKKGQQKPLDYSKKPGSGFLWYVMQGRAVARDIEEQYKDSVADIMYAKTMSIIQREYETGYLQLSDLPAVHKYMRMRHAVRRVDAAGVERVMMADEAIALEMAEKAAGTPPVPFTIIPLEERQARTIWANNSTAGLTRIINPHPELNPQDADPFPQLDEAKLQATGLTRLGEEVPVNNTELAQVTMAPTATLKRLQDDVHGAQKFFVVSTDYAQEIYHRAHFLSQSGKRVSEINSKHDDILKKLFARDRGMHLVLSATSQLYGADSSNASQAIAQMSRALRMSPDNMTLLYQMGEVSGFMEGVLTDADFRDGFGWKSDSPLKLTFGDVVILDVGNVLAHFRNNQDLAYEHLQQVIHELGKRGARIVFQSTTGDGNQLRNDLVDWIERGGVPYQRMADSRHFFEITTEKNRRSRNELAAERSLSKVTVFTGRGATLLLNVNDESALHDGATYFRWDTAEDWEIDAVIQFPSHLSRTSAGRGREYTFGLAIDRTEDPQARAKMVSDLEGMLDSLEMEDPEGTPIRKVHTTPDGKQIIEPGIVSADDAKAALLAILQSGGSLYEGRTFRPGDIIPYVDAQGNYILHRIGFVLPKDTTILEELNKPPVDYPGANRPLRVIVGKPKIEQLTTLPPDFTLEKIHYTSNGIRATGVALLDRNMKAVMQGMGVKLGMTEMPKHFHLLTDRISIMPSNLLKVAYIAGEKSMVGKGATKYRTDNFTDAWAVWGADFKQDLIDFFGEDWDTVKVLLDKWSHAGAGIHERDVLALLLNDQLLPSLRDEIVGVFKGVVPSNKLNDLLSTTRSGVAEDPTRRIVQVVMATLLLPGVRLEHVLGTTGLANLDSLQSDGQVMRMPELMGLAFDDRYSYPETFRILQERINSRVAPDSKGGRRFYTEDWRFSYNLEYPDGSRGQRFGYLEYVLPVPAQQNVASYVQRYVMSGKSDVSQHTAAIVSAGFGARSFDRPLAKTEPDSKVRVATATQMWADGTLLPQATPLSSTTSLLGSEWFNPKDPVYDSWGIMNYAEMEAIERGTSESGLFLQSLDTTEWAENPLVHSAVKQLMKDIKELLHIENDMFSDRLLEQWIRMWLGVAGPRGDQDASVGMVSVTDAQEALEAIKSNISTGDMPTMGGAQVVLHADHLRYLFRATKKALESGATEVYEPWIKGSLGHPQEFAKGWDDWVLAALTQPFEADMLFEAMNVPALTGFWQSYNGVSDLTQNLTVTPIVADAAKLRAVGAEGAMRDLVSFSELTNAVLRTPIIPESHAAGLDQLTGKAPVFSGRGALDSATSARAFHIRRRASWRAQRDMTRQNPEQSLKNLRKTGLELLENNNAQNVFFRNVALFSLMNRMANPGIWVSAMFEVPFRRLTDRFTDLVSGTTWNNLYSDDEVLLLNKLVERLGNDSLFIAEIQRELTYQVVGRGSNREKGLSPKMESGAAWMVRHASDPWQGMKGNSVAKEYLHAVLETLAVTGNAITIPQLVDEMNTNPLFLKENFGTGIDNPHNMGMARVAQTRAMKPTMLSLPISRTISWMTSSPNLATNIGGHLLHIPFMFQLYTTNALITMSGLSGWDQAAAMFFHGRRKPKFLRSGRNRELGDDGNNERWDFSDVIETMDLQRTFIKSGVNMTMLMGLALMAGNLGLDGDDEEARRRQRLAKYLNVPIVNDPYEPQNSFKYANAIFLDSIPGLDMIFKDSRGEAAVVPHWIIRQFTSPILGIQRFFDTGDLREIAYGFWDSFSVMPRSFLSLWDRADTFAGQLADATTDSATYNSTEMRQNTNQLIVGITSVYEKAVLENSFLNSLYVAKDEFDRDPFAIPLTDPATGAIVREQGTGLPMRTKATETVIGPDGKPVEKYMKRSGDEALLYAYTENNFTAATLATIGSLFTGQAPGYYRQNQVVKQKMLDLPDINADQAKAMILAAYRGGGGEFQLNKLDLVRMLKQQIEKEGKRWDQAKVENQADAILAAHDPRTSLSVGTEKGEVITQYGAERVYASLASGQIKLGDPTLSGMAISREMRDEVAKSLLNEIIQDGIDLGLSYESAYYVARRFWYGDNSTPEIPGLRELLQSPLIPENNRVEYNQLNVMYAIGPDGRPWATPFERTSTLQAFGIPLPHRVELPGPGTHLDNLGNVVDDVLGINTGLSAIVRTPTEKIKVKVSDPFKNGSLNKTASPGGGSYGRRYGSGGGGSSYGPPFQRMYELPGGTSPRFGGIPMINTSNPYIRRAQVNRERVFGERGRLKQWQ